jgi:histone-lysine N-methyltransferase SETMAR
MRARMLLPEGKQCFQEFGWEVSVHPAYRPDMDPSDFHLFPTLKKFLGGRPFKSDEKVKDAVK